ncbi:MAG: hypothetical protein ACK4VZ_02615 [Paracoccaceae bacterium]
MVDPLGMILSDPSAQLKHLRQALDRIAGSALPAAARLALAEAQVAHSELEEMLVGSGAPVNRSVFESLLAMAGPDIAQELIVQMAADLRAVSIALAQGLATTDHARIRAQTHVLVALAGSAGAQGLEQGAQALNTAAQDADDARITELGPIILAGLGALIVFVESVGADKGAHR